MVRLFANGKLIPRANYTLELARPAEKGYRILYHEESGFDAMQVLELLEIPDDQPKITRVMYASIFNPRPKTVHQAALDVLDTAEDEANG